MTTTHLINTLSYPYPLLFTFVSTLYHPLRVAPETPLQQVRRQVKEWDVIALSHERANTKKEDEEREQSQEQKRRDKEARARERMQARLGAHPLNVPPCQYTVSMNLVNTVSSINPIDPLLTHPIKPPSHILHLTLVLPIYRGSTTTS